MPDLIADSSGAAAWIAQVMAAHAHSSVFGKIASSVIWSDATGPDGKQLVPVDPVALVADITANGFTVLKGHDPGFPLGKVLAAAVFTSASGTTFVAAVLGFYHGNRLSFRELGLHPTLAGASSALLPALPDDCWINVATDPREIESAWLEGVVRAAPMRVEWTELSHNAADPLQELIRVGVPFLVLLWNPFTKAIATEAGKAVYAGMHRWFRALFDKLAERRNPILEIQSHHKGCQISFILRGTDVKRHYAAHEALPTAAAQADSLVTNMKERGFAPKLVVYEFHREHDIWFPSYAELYDGRLVTDNKLLIAVEQLPPALSLGIGRSKDKPRLPSVKG